MYRCKECGEEIDHLYYSVPATEYGNFNLADETHDSDDQSTDDDGYTYSCPECDYEASRVSSIAEEVSDEDDEDAEAPSTPTLEDGGRTNVKQGASIETGTRIFICPGCQAPSASADKNDCLVCQNH